jgi:hypothetical protein
MLQDSRFWGGNFPLGVDQHPPPRAPGRGVPRVGGDDINIRTHRGRCGALTAARASALAPAPSRQTIATAQTVGAFPGLLASRHPPCLRQSLDCVLLDTWRGRGLVTPRAPPSPLHLPGRVARQRRRNFISLRRSALQTIVKKLLKNVDSLPIKVVWCSGSQQPHQPGEKS